MKKNTITIVLLLSTSISAPSLAQTGQPPSEGWFIGAKTGNQLAHDENSHHTPDSVAFGVYSGYQFSPSLAWDIGLQYQNDMTVNDINVNTSLIESAVRYDHALDEHWFLYGRLGLAYWDMDKISDLNGKQSKTGLSPLVEAGLMYQFDGPWSVYTGYQYVNAIGDEGAIGAYDSHSILFGLMYQFGRDRQAQESLNTQSHDEADLQRQAQAQEAERQRLEQQRLAQEAEQRRLAQEAEKQRQQQLENSTLKEVNDLNDSLMIFGHQTIGTPFELSSSVITPPQRQAMQNQLDQAKAIMDRHPNVDAYFIGHTDRSGSEKFNQWISERRARSVAHELEQKGISATRIHTKGMGEMKASSTLNPADRRVEIVLACDDCQEN